ncbi:HD domain-containing protein [Nitratidesulfovibrio sp. SRB-5]|uniref:HD domain-containing protein n=1 Tax=Nitratidesulfovibrio sp. SRB-5 TaxID=2872636 RepID=UPI001027CCE3|nr:HD domain-containing protein [Nitratidesulfovibrio sp. SRB-5]MBZ2171810.1 HD domain-containing protein [Nitratidesulfovibrio sp. SRB-5]RXF78623.1 HD domain-containing protein [Desulfovibrio sp. DS-1]
MKTYLVGGAVRDLLLGRPIHDHDVAFEGDAACFVRQNPGARKVGRDVDVYLLDGVEHMPLRGTLDEDLAARDFTINALALGEAGMLHAHPLALRDLADRVLRPASPTALADSPVRAFRAARFAAQFPDFSVHPQTLEQMRAVAQGGALADLPAEQVCRETLKALAAPCPGRYLKVLHAGGCLPPWLAELAGAHEVPAGPARYHSGSVLAHVARVMDMAAALAGYASGAGDGGPAPTGSTMTDSTGAHARPAQQPPPELVTWMALCHDLGKVTTATDVLPHHYGHEDRGAPLARALGLRLCMPTRFIEAGEAAARLHMRLARHAELRPGTRVDLLLALHTRGLLPAMRLLVLADGTGKGMGTGPDCALRQPEGTAPALAFSPDADTAAAGGWPAAAAPADPLAPYDPPHIPAACLTRLETLRQRTEAELAVLLAVKLPPELCNKGAASGAHLRELRSMALARLDEHAGTATD